MTKPETYRLPQTGVWSIFFLSVLLIVSCSIRFSFNPGNLPKDIKTVSIEKFENNAAVVVPTLSQDFSEKIRDVFQAQTNLKLVSKYGDINISGVISTYTVAPISIQGDNSAAQNRLTITVSATLKCEKHEDLEWENTRFSNFEDFSSTSSITDVQDELIELINEKNAQDLFNKTFSNW